MRGARHRRVIVLLAIVVLAGCSPSNSTPSPGRSASALPATEVPGSTANPTPAGSPTPADPFLGQIAVTVSENLRVRSEPRVSDDSIKYEPLLPLGTELKVLGGPVEGSGYVWYKVLPVSLTGLEGPGYGWVAMAGKDGEPWIALANAPIPGIELAQADVARAPADPAAAKIAAASINAFGLDLLRAILADPKLGLAGKNAVFSPTSIALALAMARAGAKGETAAQMDAVLHTSGWDELGPGLNALEQALTSRNATWSEPYQGPNSDTIEPRELTLRIANASFAQQGWSIEGAYLDAIAAAFGAGVRLVDYIVDPEAARKAINAWVSDRTLRRIPELLAVPDVSPSTRLFLVNAIYLKANWATEFDPTKTKSEPFTRLDGSKVDVPTMSVLGEQEIPFAHGTGWQAVELRYRGRDYTRPLAMTLILPDDLATFEARLSASQLARITTAMTDERNRLGIDGLPVELGERNPRAKRLGVLDDDGVFRTSESPLE